MDTFPTLSAQSTLSPAGYSEQQSSAGDLVTQTDAGYKLTRATFTRQVRTFKASYRALNDSDKALLDAFINTVGITGSFTWTQPITNSVVEVRFVERPAIVRDGIYWAMAAKLEEV